MTEQEIRDDITQTKRIFCREPRTGNFRAEQLGKLKASCSTMRGTECYTTNKSGKKPDGELYVVDPGALRLTWMQKHLQADAGKGADTAVTVHGRSFSLSVTYGTVLIMSFWELPPVIY